MKNTQINRIIGLCLILAFVMAIGLPMTSCDNGIGGNGGNDGNSGNGGNSGNTGNSGNGNQGSNPKAVLVNISQETEWDYMVVGEDQSTLFFNVDETTNMPTEMVFRPYKDSDNVFTLLLKDGLPDKMVAQGHILYFGNFSEYQFDMAVIKPNGDIEYYSDIEHDINTNNYPEQIVLYASGNNARSASSNEIKDITSGTLKYVGYAAGVVTCVAAFACPPLLAGCIMAGVSALGSLEAEYLLDGYAEDVANGAMYAGNTVLNGIDCASAFTGNPAGVVGCISIVADSASLALDIDKKYFRDNNEEINEATTTIKNRTYPPNRPKYVTANAYSSSCIRLDWSDVSSSSSTSYDIYRCTVPEGHYEKINTTNISSYFDNDINLTEDTTYYYKIRANNSYGSSSLSDYVYATTYKNLPENPPVVVTAPSWIPTTPASNIYITSIAYGNGKFVYVSKDKWANDKIAYSSNGITWTPIDVSYVSSNFTLNDITYGNGAFIAVGSDSTTDKGLILYSSNGSSWSDTKTNNTSLGTDYIGIAYGGGKFVIVDDLCYYQTSTDGITWATKSQLSTFNGIRGITYGNDKFVAVGSSGKMAYSTNGTSWTAVTDSTFGTTDAILAITYGKGKYVAVGSYGKIAYSTNGISWTAVENSTFGETLINRVAYGNGKFVAVGNNGKMAWSTDGITWTAIPVGTGTGTSTFGNYDDIYSIAYGNGKFIAGGFGKIAYSMEGSNDPNIILSSTKAITGFSFPTVKKTIINESTKTINITVPNGTNVTNLTPTITHTGVSYSPVGARDFTNPVKYTVTAEDGTKQAYTVTVTISQITGPVWTIATAATKIFGTNADYSRASSITYNGSKFVAVGYNGKMAYSADGISWTNVTNNTFSTSWITAIAYGNGRFVAGSKDGKMAYSTDGTYWTAVTNSIFGTEPIYKITYGNGMFIAVGGGSSGSKMAYSTNGTSWTAVTNNTFSSIPSAINGIIYDNGKFVAVGSNGKIAYSSNGTTWTAVANSTFGETSINRVAYGNGKFVAVGSSGKMAYSTDGVTWTAIPAGTGEGTSTFTSNPIYDIAYGNGKFIAVGGTRMAYSLDGVTWTAIPSGTGEGTCPISGTNCIIYGGGKFVAGGCYGQIAYCEDW